MMKTLLFLEGRDDHPTITINGLLPIQDGSEITITHERLVKMTFLVIGSPQIHIVTNGRSTNAKSVEIKAVIRKMTHEEI